jgi:hypothetical protein
VRAEGEENSSIYYVVLKEKGILNNEALKLYSK